MGQITWRTDPRPPPSPSPPSPCSPPAEPFASSPSRRPAMGLSTFCIYYSAFFGFLGSWGSVALILAVLFVTADFEGDFVEVTKDKDGTNDDDDDVDED